MNTVNNQTAKDIGKKRLTFWHWFRLVFTLFSLYLIGDVFYRWDGFKFHSSFSQYLPNVALALIIWSIVAFLSSIVVWLPLKAFERVCGYLGIKIKAEHLVLYLFVFVFVAAFAWVGKKIIWSNMETSLKLKMTAIIFISCAAIPLAWLLRSKAKWINMIQERITPLVWLFTICIMLSMPVVGFHMWGKNTNKVMSPGFTKSPVLESNKKRPNILLVTFDALTARDMSVYGYDRKTTPFMEKWANAASLFTRTKACSNHTASTTPCIMTGKRLWTHRKYQWDLSDKPVKSDIENLPLVMKENGYYTSAFISNIVASVDALDISRSIDTAPSVKEFMRPVSIEGIIDKYLFRLFGAKFSTYNWLGQEDFIFDVLLRRIPQKVSITEYPPELVFNKFLEVMDNNPREPFFAWLHVFPPHDTYLPPEPFAGTFNASRELRDNNTILSITPETNPYLTKGLPLPKELRRKIKLLRDYYDEFILYCDKQFENFNSELQERNWSENTVIIVSADHGESFERDYYQHGKAHLYEQVTHIPLIIKEPEQTKGRIIDDLVEQIDIPATILDLANIPVPSWMEGHSVLPLLRDHKLPSKTVIASNFDKNDKSKPITEGSIALWDGDYKLVNYLHIKNKAISAITGPLLFNLKDDPGEMHNLFNEEPEIGQRLLKITQDKLKQANERIIAGK